MDVLIASAVFATLVAVGLPRLVSWRAPYAVMAGSRSIAAAFRTARQKAISQNTSYRINFDTSAQKFSIDYQNAGNWTQFQAPTQLPCDAKFGTISPAGNPVFTAQGTLAAAVTVPITGQGAHTKTVAVDVLGQTTIN
jgi:Tfp pilus assembly protein FimT